MDFPSESELAERGIREIVSTPGSQITVEVARTDATDANILIHASAAMADEVVGQAIDLESGTFLDSCTGQKLDRYLWDRYRLKRPGATPAFNSALFVTASPAPANFTIPGGTIVQTPDGVQYVTISDQPYPKGLSISSGPGVYSGARSVLAGSAQRTSASSANPVTLSILNQIPGSPADLTASFNLASAGGADEMGDPEFRQIGRDFFANATLGTIPAIEAVAKRVNGVKTARSFEVLTPEGRPQKLVVLVISDAYTEAYADLSAQPPTYAAQSQLLAVAVQQALVDVRGAGTALVVVSGFVVLMAVQMTLAFIPGVNFNSVAMAARAAVFNYTNSLRAGESWVYADAEQALRTVNGLSWTGMEIVSPSGNVVNTSSGKLLRTDLRLVQQLGGPNPDSLLTGP